MNVMKTSLTVIPMCPQERFPSYKSLSRLVLCYKKDWVHKTSLMIIPMCPREHFPLYKSLSRLVLCYKKDWAILLHLTFITCCSLQITLSQNYLSPIILVFAENTLLKTAYHFLLLLVGFDTLTYRKDYDRSPILVGHQHPSSS